MAHYTFKTVGTCSTVHEFDLEDGKIYNFKPHGGCPGNLKAIGILINGMDAAEVADTLEGICCGFRSTSCGDQLATGIRKALSGKLKPVE